MVSYTNQSLLRIKLEHGKQKQLIEKTKLKSGLTWKSLAAKLGCGQNYLLNELRNERRTLSETLYDKICHTGKMNFDDFVVCKFSSNWGQIKGGRSVQNRKNLFSAIKPKILCEQSPALAELVGIMLGDGSIYVVPEKGLYQVSVVGNLKDEDEYISKYVKPLFESVFKLKMCIKETGNVLYVYKNSKDLVFTFKKYGLLSGSKKRNGVKIPNWIMSNNTYLERCIRGIFDTDGCVYPKNKANLYPTIWISSAIPSLRNSIATAYERLKLNLSKWKSGRNDAYLDRRKDVFKFFDEIQFKNIKHLKRWSRFNRLPSSSPVNS